MALYVTIALEICAIWLYTVAAAPMYHSCAELYKSNVVRASAPYTIYNNNNQSFQVYCEFHHGYGYTYISPATTVPVNIDNLHTGSDHVLIRDLRDDDKQFQVTLEQITRYHKLPLSIQYTSHNGYNGIQNPKMTPYVYIGLVPASGQHLHNLEGYRINGQDWTFSNCDGNPNSYFAFLFNHNNVAPTGYNPTDSTLLHQWIDRATPVASSNYLPNNFFSFFEVHMGGCGAYGTNQQFHHVKGAAVGLRYDIMCPAAQDIPNGGKRSTGNMFSNTTTYTCNQGYHVLTGDLTRTCSETGQWTGKLPICGQAACDSHPCQNGGTCFVEGSSFTCECPTGVTGIQCQTVS